MRTTIAAIFHGVGRRLEIVEVPVPDLRGPEILVEVVACTLCGSDLHSLQGRRVVPVPTILGHETLGRIVEFGPTATRVDASGHPLSEGDRVTWAIVANCGDCFYCRRSLPQKCERQTKYGHEAIRPGLELTGGLAGHCVLAPGTAIFAIPVELSEAATCPANCAGATVGAAIEGAGPLNGSRVLVMGCGMLGVTAIAWARSLGAEHVIASDVDAARLAMADAFGATRRASPDDLASVVLESTEGQGVDVAFEMTGASEAFEAILPLVRMGGSIILVGSVFPSRAVSLALEQIVRRCLTLRGLHNYAPRHLRAALDFLDGPARQWPFGSLVTAWEPLMALDRVLSRPVPSGKLRIGIRP